MATFDHMARIRALIDSEAHGAYNARDVAAQVVAKLRATDPDLLAAWLDAQAVQVMYSTINTRDRSLRAHVRRSTAAAAFERDVAAGPEAMGRWLEVPYSVEQGIRKPLGDMTAHDLSAAAQAYRMRAIDNRMVEAFLLALSRRVGSGTVRDHYSDEQVGAMWLSITGGSERP